MNSDRPLLGRLFLLPFLGLVRGRGGILIFLLVFSACENLFPPNDFDPTGTPFSLNPGIAVVAITGDRRHFSENGLFTLNLVCRAEGASPLSDTLPAGLLFTSTKRSTQHMIILKEHRFTAQPNLNSLIIGVFCCNRTREIPAEDDSFQLGPLTDNPALKELVNLVKNKRISVNLGMVQRALWMITDSTGLNQAYIDSLNALPDESPLAVSKM